MSVERPPEPWRSPWLWATVVLALVLRLPRLANRWDEVALAYSAYAAPASEALWAGRPGDAVAAWVGLHPPLHALLLAVLDGVWPAPALWIVLSIGCSLGAVLVVGRHAGPVAALVLASAPLQLQDAAEVNNYPLAVLGVAVLVATRRLAWPWFLLGVGLASWGHVLGLAAAGVVTAHRLVWPVDTRERWQVGGGAALLAAPVVVGAARLAGQSSTFAQPAPDWGAWLELVAGATGVEGLVLMPLVVLGLVWSRGGHSAAWAGVAGTYCLALWVGAAAAHQRPYLGLLGPPAAVAVAMLVGRARMPSVRVGLTLLIVGVCVVRSARAGWVELDTVRAIQADLSEERGVDLALRQSGPGDVVWLVAPALRADDDKSDHSAVLWRLSPWSAMPRATVDHPAFAFTDWLWGQPRWMDGRVVHTSTELDPGRFDVVVARAHADGQRVVVVLYDHAPATGLADRVERAVRVYGPAAHVVPRDHGLGDDYVWVLSPPDPTRARR